MNRLGIYQRFRINSDFGARPKKKYSSPKHNLAMPPKNTGKSSPSKNKKGKERARQDDAINEALRDVADELAAVPGSPSPSPTNQGASASNGAGAVASGSDGSVVPAELLKRRVEQRTKERDEATAKAEALEKRIKELEAEGKVIHLLFSN
jgi:hypothetical protein